MNKIYCQSSSGRGIHRVTKATAKKLFVAGKEVLLYPCNTNPSSPWFGECSMDKGEDFDVQVNAFSYYNCSSEAGRYPAFYAVDGQD